MDEQITRKEPEQGKISLKNAQTGKTFVRNGLVWTVWNPKATLYFITHNFFSIVFVIFLLWLCAAIWMNDNSITIDNGQIEIVDKYARYEQARQNFIDEHRGEFQAFYDSMK